MASSSSAVENKDLTTYFKSGLRSKNKDLAELLAKNFFPEATSFESKKIDGNTKWVGTFPQEERSLQRKETQMTVRISETIIFGKGSSENGNSITFGDNGVSLEVSTRDFDFWLDAFKLSGPEKMAAKSALVATKYMGREGFFSCSLIPINPIKLSFNLTGVSVDSEDNVYLDVKFAKPPQILEKFANTMLGKTFLKLFLENDFLSTLKDWQPSPHPISKKTLTEFFEGSSD